MMYPYLIALFLIGLYIILYLQKLKTRRGRYTKPTRIDGKIVLITGGSTGIGKACAIELAKRGGKIYIACRDEAINEKAFEDIRRESGSDKIHYLELDLASLKSIRTFSQKFHQLETRLDILINNAGVLTNEKQITEDGFEMHMGVNYLGHFLLTNLLLDVLKASTPSRIILVSSVIHKVYHIDREDLMSDRYFSKYKAYGMSKLAIILFTKELSKRLEGTKVTVNCCHPGLVKTDLTREILHDVISRIYTLVAKTPLQGAQSHIRLAIDPDLETVSGKYFVDCMEQETSNKTKNAETAKWLWEKSSELVYLNNNH